MKIITISHEMNGTIRLTIGDKVLVYDNSARLAEALAHEIVDAEAMRTFVDKVRKLTSESHENTNTHPCFREQMLKLIAEEPF